MYYVVSKDVLQLIVNFLVAHPDKEKKGGLTARIQLVDLIGKAPTLSAFQAEEARRAEASKAEGEKKATAVKLEEENKTLTLRIEELTKENDARGGTIANLREALEIRDGSPV